MDKYLKTLKKLKKVLEKEGYQQWADWIEIDIQNWIKKKDTQHHLDAFGGMGSILDLSYDSQRKIDDLLDITYEMATTIKAIQDLCKIKALHA